MANVDRNPVLIRLRLTRCSWVGIACLTMLLTGCGPLFDAIATLRPGAKDLHRDVVCTRHVVHVGIAAGPYPPFIFPVAQTESGPKVTGLDIELLKELVQGLTNYCGDPVRPSLRLIPFPALFRYLQEGTIDLFLSGTPSDIPAPGTSGFGYSVPYVREGGIVALIREPAVANEVQRRLQGLRDHALGIAIAEQALKGFRLGVQESTSAELYAKAVLPQSPLFVCRSLQAAFDAVVNEAAPAQVILGSSIVLQYAARRQPMEQRWEVLRHEGMPVRLTHEQYSIVISGSRYQLRWFVNNLLVQMEERGKLNAMRRRWLTDDYEYEDRIAQEGISVPEGAAEEQARRGCWQEK